VSCLDRAALTYAFTDLGREEAISVIYPGNKASIRVAERIGASFDHREAVRGHERLIYRVVASAALR
jgi:RimJ/RimL family protein N-acetyltransferase